MEYALGFAMALVVGITGMGGGVLATPLLVLFLGLPATQAVGTALVFVTVIKLTAAPWYWLRGQVSWKAVRLLTLGGVPGVLAGALLLNGLRTKQLDAVVLALVGITIIAAALASFLKSFYVPHGKDRPHRLPWLAAPIGVEVGFSSAGAGALGSLVLMEYSSLAAAEIVGTDLVFGLALSAAGGFLHAGLGNVNTGVLGHLCAGGIAGAMTGAWLAGRTPRRLLRAALSFVMVMLGAQMVWKGLVR